jgi:3-hydroxy-3-methylglutaryl CoA synthase
VAGIASYGAYVPRTRLPLSALGGRPAQEGGPEKAVAWNDEDAVTMAVSAGVNCLRGLDRSQVDGVVFASTTYPFQEKLGAALLAKALDLRRDVRTTDLGGSLRAGTSALRAAIDAVRAGSARRVLAVASDCRMAAPGSSLEASLGDGAAAFLISDENPVLVFDGDFAVADEIVDLWRTREDAFVHSWEDRFVVQEGYLPNLVEAVLGTMRTLGKDAGDFARVAFYGPDARSHGSVARKLGLVAEQVQAPLFGRLGNAGCAFAPLLLAAALESLSPGERVIVASYGDGAEALAFTANEHLEKLGPRRGVSWHLERRRPVASYDRYLKARNLNATEWQSASGPGLSATVHHRERDEDLALLGQQCKACGAIQFPKQRLCESCFAKDDFAPVRLSDRTGRVVTYTFDFFFPTPDPPTVVTVTDVDGARIHVQLVDVRPEDVKPGLPVGFEFRRIHSAGGRPNYYWKASPAEEGA